MSRAELEARFLSALPVIEQTIRFVAGRNRLSTTEQEDFASEVKLSFIQDDYKVLAAFQGRSTLKTYLVVVIQRLFLDYRRKLWGKWHPSAEAMRLGPLAQRLEILVHREGHTVSEACEMLRVNHGVQESRETLLDLVNRLPVRQRTHVRDSASAPGTEDAVAAVPAAGSSNPHQAFLNDEAAGRCQAALERAVGSFPPDDRVLLRLRFEDDLSVADIARGLHLDQKKLYRRLEGLLDALREAMESAGLSLEDIRALLDSGRCDLRLSRSISVAEKRDLRPSPVRVAP